MLAKIVILACVMVATKQEPQLVAGLPYIANYASSYEAHAVNHDIRVPVTPVAPVIKTAPLAATISQTVATYSPFAPLTSTVPQSLITYSPAAVSYSAGRLVQTSPIISPQTTTVNLQNPQPATSRSSSAQIEKDPKLSRSTQLPENQQRNPISSAVLLASQFLARTTALQRNPAISSRITSENSNYQRSELNQQSLRPEENQRSLPILVTPTRFNIPQRAAARLSQSSKDSQVKANPQSGQLRERQRDGENAKLIRENEEAESIEISNPNGQVYESEGITVRTPIVPARLALTPNVNLLPNVYTGVISF